MPISFAIISYMSRVGFSEQTLTFHCSGVELLFLLP